MYYSVMLIINYYYSIKAYSNNLTHFYDKIIFTSVDSLVLAFPVPEHFLQVNQSSSLFLSPYIFDIQLILSILIPSFK